MMYITIKLQTIIIRTLQVVNVIAKINKGNVKILKTQQNPNFSLNIII